ncbi:MAG: hypothetical protein AAF363_10065 [Bacteroidota bacterium]
MNNLSAECVGETRSYHIIGSSGECNGQYQVLGGTSGVDYIILDQLNGSGVIDTQWLTTGRYTIKRNLLNGGGGYSWPLSPRKITVVSSSSAPPSVSTTACEITFRRNSSPTNGTEWSVFDGTNWIQNRQLITHTGGGITFSNPGQYIDEIRIYPRDAQMQSYTYEFSQINSITDTNGTTVYYEYDNHRRLKAVKDFEGNVLSVHDYQYYNPQ